jgi:hypothetical protein
MGEDDLRSKARKGAKLDAKRSSPRKAGSQTAAHPDPKATGALVTGLLIPPLFL